MEKKPNFFFCVVQTVLQFTPKTDFSPLDIKIKAIAVLSSWMLKH